MVAEKSSDLIIAHTSMDAARTGDIKVFKEGVSAGFDLDFQVQSTHLQEKFLCLQDNDIILTVDGDGRRSLSSFSL